MTKSTSEKSKEIVVDIHEYFSKISGGRIIRELKESQIACPNCEGSGYYISPDKQYIENCRECYNGIINLCEYCNGELPRFTSLCNCEEYKRSLSIKEAKEEKEKYDKAIKLKHNDEIAKNMAMYYHESYPYNNGYFSDLEDITEWWDSEYEKYDQDDEKPTYVWGTYSIHLTMDADSIIENACDDLHEEASSNISDIDIKELQEFLDKWCEKQAGTTSYYEESKYAIEIPW